jgi:hypothetical protein
MRAGERERRSVFRYNLFCPAPAAGLRVLAQDLQQGFVHKRKLGSWRRTLTMQSMTDDAWRIWIRHPPHRASTISPFRRKGSAAASNAALQDVEESSWCPMISPELRRTLACGSGVIRGALILGACSSATWRVELDVWPTPSRTILPPSPARRSIGDPMPKARTRRCWLVSASASGPRTATECVGCRLRRLPRSGPPSYLDHNTDPAAGCCS